jgi:hypothetical protein
MRGRGGHKDYFDCKANSMDIGHGDVRPISKSPEIGNSESENLGTKNSKIGIP